MWPKSCPRYHFNKLTSNLCLDFFLNKKFFEISTKFNSFCDKCEYFGE